MKSTLTQTHLSKRAGFTLIELMIVVVVIGILAAIAYPAYLENVRKARRADAQAALVGMAAAMERYMVNNNGTYLGAAGAGGAPGPAIFYSDQVPVDGGRATYSLRIQSLTPAANPNSYVLSAIPVNAQLGDRCGTLTLAASGQQGRTGTAPLTECWRN